MLESHNVNKNFFYTNLLRKSVLLYFSRNLALECPVTHNPENTLTNIDILFTSA